MRAWAKVCCLLAFGAGAAWAQTVTTVTTTATPVAVPVAVVPLPPLSPVAVTQDVTGAPILLVLGSEETFALSNISVRNLNWSDVPSNYVSLFEEGNPLSYTRVNGAVTRHGNPYHPYYLSGTSATVAGLEERFIAGQVPLTATDRATLQTVYTRYRGLTPAQAMTLGYQPTGAFTPGLGQVYLNQALLTVPFNAVMPQAFVFNRQGKLVAVQYYVMSAQPVTIFGQPATSSTLAPGAQQVTVWLYTNNRNGLFAGMNPNIK